MNNDDIEVAKLAAITSGELRKVDSTMMERNARGPANRLDPRSFLNKNRTKVPTNATRPINNPNIIQAPVARPAGREVVGTEAVDIGSLLIPLPEGVSMPPEGNIPMNPQPQIQMPPPHANHPAVPRSNFIPHNAATGNLEQRLTKLEKKVSKIDKKINTILKKIK